MIFTTIMISCSTPDQDQSHIIKVVKSGGYLTAKINNVSFFDPYEPSISYAETSCKSGDVIDAWSYRMPYYYNTVIYLDGNVVASGNTTLHFIVP